MRVRILMMLVVSVATAGILFQPAWTSAAWVEKTAMSDSRFDPVCATDGTNKIFVFGGVNGFGFSLRLGTVYNIDQDTWSATTSLPNFLSAAKGVYIDNMIYFPGGYEDGTVVGTMVAYVDLLLFPYFETDLSPVPDPRYAYSAEAIDGILYLCGGGDSTDTSRSECWSYNPDTDVWTSIASMSEARRYHGSGVIGGRMVVFGGVGISDVELNSVEIYDPDSNTWSTAADLPMMWWGGVSAVVNGLLAFSHGLSADVLNPSTYVYNETQDQWRVVSTSVVQKRYRLGGVSADGALWALAGDPLGLMGFPSDKIECNYSVTTTTTTTTTTTRPSTTTTHPATTTTTSSTVATTTTVPPDDDADDDAADDSDDDTGWHGDDAGDDDDGLNNWDDDQPSEGGSNEEKSESGGCG